MFCKKEYESIENYVSKFIDDDSIFNYEELLLINAKSFFELKDYEKSRKIDIITLVNATHGLNELFRNSTPYVKAFRRLGLSAVNKTPFLKRAFMKYAMGV